MAKKRPASNRRRNRAPTFDAKGWARHHWLCCKDSALSLLKSPISSALTWLVIAIALLLPTLFYISLQALNSQADTWQEGGQITLYLTFDTEESSGRQLAQELTARAEILRTEYISQEQAWASFNQTLSLESNLELAENPLPASIVAIPVQQSQADLEALLLMLRDLPEVNDIQIDLAWIDRLNRLLDLARSMVLLLSLILSVAVLLIVGNTIRLSIESRKAEVQIIKLLGATDAYVRRPFLYLGLWFGLLGGIAAWVMLTAISVSFQQRLDGFLGTYGLDAPAIWLNATELSLLLLTSVIVSLAGARIALWRHLKDTDPS
ncbi:permease-like cell division protein FtsX [Reinekea blandensis]|uniref:Cell division protein FtsX n=1 Tax=Reinekea blandensis MED297 TaxID=314283 RepID=A4BAK1_9GAMM|nr:permease-like cell division protein FtsX [Reinekea blandensis]EAR10957.1 Cell division protein [Reinekea sp. MED297] [Reinekea blandensis MED297]